MQELNGKLNTMKKGYTYLLCILLTACFKEPFEMSTSKQIFIDAITNSDTIIVNYNHQYNSLDAEIYYAQKNWQTVFSPLSNRGTRNIVIRTSDTISILKSNNIEVDNYYFKFSDDGFSLESQQFLIAPNLSMKRFFRKIN